MVGGDGDGGDSQSHEIVRMRWEGRRMVGIG